MNTLEKLLQHNNMVGAAESHSKFLKKIKILSTRILEGIAKHEVMDFDEMYIHQKGPHTGLYAKCKWVCWLNEEEIIALKHLGVEVLGD